MKQWVGSDTWTWAGSNTWRGAVRHDQTLETLRSPRRDGQRQRHHRRRRQSNERCLPIHRRRLERLVGNANPASSQRQPAARAVHHEAVFGYQALDLDDESHQRRQLGRDGAARPDGTARKWELHPQSGGGQPDHDAPWEYGQLPGRHRGGREIDQRHLRLHRRRWSISLTGAPGASLVVIYPGPCAAIWTQSSMP